jgi:hypothetical protein
MSHYHTVIANERRTGDRANSTRIKSQLHSMGTALNAPNDNNILMAVEWESNLAPYVIAHKGDYSAVTMRYAGWPEVTKEEYDMKGEAEI